MSSALKKTMLLLVHRSLLRVCLICLDFWVGHTSQRNEEEYSNQGAPCGNEQPVRFELRNMSK